MSVMIYNRGKTMESSLKLPNGVPMDYYDIDNWHFEMVKFDSPKELGEVCRVQAKSKLFGYDKEVYVWKATEKDLVDYGQGTPEMWTEYVRRSFLLSLLDAKAKIINKIAQELKLSDKQTMDLSGDFF